jgi:hypothetical protein
MTRLRELQQKFQEYVLSHVAEIDAEVVDGPGTSAATRLKIYSDAYRLRLVEALATDYTVTKKLLGDDRFDGLARAYIDAHPSTVYNVRWFGVAFADFLRGAEPDEPHFAEMAAFEWAMTLAFDAPDENALTVDEMAAAPADAWPGMTFRAHSSLNRLELNFNVPRLWKAIDTGQQAPRVRENRGHWIIWRRDYKTYFRSLDESEHRALEALCAGADFARICEELAQAVAEDAVALKAAGLLKGWISEGLLSAVFVAR